ncbi:phosphotransferase-like protein [Akkermansia muciniphila]|uniref:phosphotransferase-like protein n=2 Tax=Akkermansia muciniphila TaxID=239935 RepID=UPI00201E58CB|nr:AAA family ATPase [Akkermansia muciniphila]
MPPQPLRKKILPGVCPARHDRQQRFRPHRAILMIALTELFIHDAHEPSMTAASDILWKPACLSRQEAPSLTEGDGTCRPGNGDRNTSASRPENHETMGEKDHAENRKAPRPRSGRVILLNGASSAGKSTLARNLQLLLKEAAMIFSMDDYLAMSRGKHETALDAVRESGLPFIESFHAAIAEAARKGALVIVDHVIGESRRWIQDLLNRLDGIPRILVRVECRQDVLLERERRRTDRTPAPAHAQRQHAGIHRHFPHDFSIDTSADTPRKCAMQLISLLPGEFLP